MNRSQKSNKNFKGKADKKASGASVDVKVKKMQSSASKKASQQSKSNKVAADSSHSPPAEETQKLVHQEQYAEEAFQPAKNGLDQTNQEGDVSALYDLDATDAQLIANDQLQMQDSQQYDEPPNDSPFQEPPPNQSPSQASTPNEEDIQSPEGSSGRDHINQPYDPQHNEMSESLQGSITKGQNDDIDEFGARNDRRALTGEQIVEENYNQLEMDLGIHDNADQFTNFDRDNMIDGSFHEKTEASEEIGFGQVQMHREKDHDEDVVDPDDASDDFANVDLNALENDEGNLNQESTMGDIDINMSIHPLTVRDGQDFYTDENAPKRNDYNYPEGFNTEDDLKAVQQTDQVDQQIKLNDMKDKSRGEPDEKVREECLAKFRKEVDFHHKVAYRYEKAYRLVKKWPEKKQALNFEIIDIISEHSDYIEQDPMALFYCLYFCIYYNNPDLVEFLRTLIQKMEGKPDKIDVLLEYIDVNGIQRLRTIGEIINSHVYHIVFYQAVDDELRVVYSQILRQLKFIQLRDKDALNLLKQRDYELVQLSFEKYTSKINIPMFIKRGEKLKSHNYRKYNQAFYEEILIDFYVEARIAQNYRERFLQTKEDIILVLQMYSKNDYVSYFFKQDLEDITHEQFVELFQIAVKTDSMKVAAHIYLRYLTTFDINNKIMEIFIMSLKDTNRFHEYKLFFIHQHFDVLTIYQMNQLVDIYMEALNRSQHKLNPMLSQYNTIKYCLLIYRISWRIEQKKIYSLITKCTLLNTYLMKGLCKYLEKQHHIAHLYKLMREPILHMTERKDSLDIMLEMNMETLLQHPVIIEVLNLVYEGKYSVDSTALSLSQTFQSFFQMKTTDLKSINLKLINNIKTFGEVGGNKQASLQFNIWKHCIEQREQDEMLFSVLVSVLVVALSFYLDSMLSLVVADMDATFGASIVGKLPIIENASAGQRSDFCQAVVPHLTDFGKIVSALNPIIIFGGVGYLTAVIQKIAVVRLKDNVKLSMVHILLEVGIVICSFLFVVIDSSNPSNSLVTDQCSEFVAIDAEQAKTIDYAFDIISQTNGLNFQVVMSGIVFCYTLVMVVMLQRTEKLGELIIMVCEMITELNKFFITFGMLIGAFIIVGRQLNEEFKEEQSSFFQIVLDIFDGFNGKQDYSEYTMPQGKIFISLFVYMFNVLLLSFLVAMFINKYKFVWKNLDALKRMNIIKLKNSCGYDTLTGGITITFFPISIIILPLILPVVIFKSERLNDFILKIQYGFMILMYCLIALCLSVFVWPIMYIKSVLNSFYILAKNKPARQDYKGQDGINAVITVAFGPAIVIVSLIIDMISLPNQLLREERAFESKYQAWMDVLTQDQTDVIIRTFTRMFYVSFHKDYAGKAMTYIEVMNLHSNVFKIVGNMHDLCCRGTKDYRESLITVVDFNMTKILARKCAVPSKCGDVKNSLVDLNVMYAIQMDVELYNYYDTLFADYRAGKLTATTAAERRKLQKQEEEEKESDKRLNAGVVFLPYNKAPAGMTYKRNNQELMNNYFVDIAARSFTDIEEYLASREDRKEANKDKETLNELEGVRKNWTSTVQNEITKEFDKFDQAYHKFRSGGPDEDAGAGQGKSSTSANHPNDPDKGYKTTASAFGGHSEHAFDKTIGPESRKSAKTKGASDDLEQLVNA